MSNPRLDRASTYLAELTPHRTCLFLTNYLVYRRSHRTSAPLRGALGFAIWLKWRPNNARATRCLLTGRRRGMVIRRFPVARTRIKPLAGTGRLFGLRKSSW